MSASGACHLTSAPYTPMGRRSKPRAELSTASDVPRHGHAPLAAPGAGGMAQVGNQACATLLAVSRAPTPEPSAIWRLTPLGPLHGGEGESESKQLCKCTMIPWR
jgi:hypothetical protein